MIAQTRVGALLAGGALQGSRDQFFITQLRLLFPALAHRELCVEVASGIDDGGAVQRNRLIQIGLTTGVTGAQGAAIKQR